MDQRVFIARLNIEHLRNKLRSETDHAKRQRITELLAEEETKLAALLDRTEHEQEDKS